MTSIALTSITAGALVHYLATRRNRIGRDEGEGTVVRLSAWDRLLHAGLGLSFAVLLITGFQASLISGQGLTGYPLLLHCTAGGMYAVCLALAALTWAEDCRFQGHDLEWLRHAGGRSTGDRTPAGRLDFLEKILFWLTCLFSLVSLLSILLMMTPLFTHPGQEALLEVHRYTALLVVCLAVVHGYRTTIWKSGAWRILVSGRVGNRWARHYHALWLERIEKKDESSKT